MPRPFVANSYYNGILCNERRMPDKKYKPIRDVFLSGIHILRLKYVQTLFYRVRIPQKKMPRTQTLCKAIQKMLPENQTVVRRNKRFNLAA